ncbi:hypothetical protein GCM10025864_09510 [Luteimicrobium album]|uniref:HTH lacI-type domain-containing protein n=1 Tax=Luteimicrobium album TaxID=1054550 RepID=A0ABQ6HYZ0_9MICO|nr:hypothetical protein GCM10025864_09510 [Luteimicrobium album]
MSVMTEERGAASSPNIQRVAEAAGVSKTTVSHVLSGKRPVAPETQARVRRVMDELGFRPNFYAQALNSTRTHTIGLIVQDLTNPYYPALARGLQAAVAASGDVVMLFDATAGGALTKTFVDNLQQRRADGVVVAVGGFDAEIELLQRSGVAVVAIGAGGHDVPVDWVSADDARIGADATSVLQRAGHTRIGLISGPAGVEPGRAVAKGSCACSRGPRRPGSSRATGTVSRAPGRSASSWAVPRATARRPSSAPTT